MSKPNQDNKAHSSIEKDINTYQHKTILRFITCGSVDDGKSTLIGRLLYDSKMIFEDQLAQLQSDSERMGTQGKNIDFALLVDGLAAEREQGITIDVAYRFFTTEKRTFIVADTPGHEQYTKNMVTAASTADVAIILVDAQKGIAPQTRRHSYIAHLLGVRHLLLAVNKMDVVEYSQQKYQEIVADYGRFMQSIGKVDFIPIPTSGLVGDNITTVSHKMPWYTNPPLLDILETVTIDHDWLQNKPLYMPVQWVNRPNATFRGFAGTLVSGSVHPEDAVRILPDGSTTSIVRIVTADGDLPYAVTGQSVTLTFKHDVDCSRGNIIADAKHPLEVADQFLATIIWMDAAELVIGQAYYIKIGTQTLTARITKIKHQININTMEKLAAHSLALNAIGVVTINIDKAIPFAPYTQNRTLGGCIVLDKKNNATVGAGLLHFALSRSQNIHRHATLVTRKHRAKTKNQKPLVLWLTGLSGSGKSTIANALEKQLFDLGYHTFLLDGDNLRHGLNRDLGFTKVDRIENIRRVGEVAKLMLEAGLVVIAACISPFAEERKRVKKMMPSRSFVEIFVDAPLEIIKKQDVKGLYAKAQTGKLRNFTGIDSPYEKPKHPDIHIDTTSLNVIQAVDIIMAHFHKQQQ